MLRLMGPEAGGLSLRFPRFIRARDDKSLPDDAKVTRDQLLHLPQLNKIIQNEYGTDSAEIFRLYAKDVKRKQAILKAKASTRQ